MSDSSLMGITIMDITDFNITELNADTKTALSLHQSILQAEQTAANAMVTLCESLKTIRDRQLYKPLGFETFDGYTERACGIKRRQAYNYISVYEKLGSTILQSNASLGITKLQPLTEVCAVDREDFITENNLEGMSVSEIKKLVEKSKEQGEQISLLSDELEDNEKSKEILLSENEELRRQVKELESRPVEVAVQSPSEEEIKRAAEKKTAELAEKLKNLQEENAKIKSEQKAAVKKATEKAVKKAEKEYSDRLNEEKDRMRADIDARYKEKIEAAEQERKEALKKAEEMAGRLDKNADAELVTATLYFGEIQRNTDKFTESVAKIAGSDPDKGEKLRGIAKSYFDSIAYKFN